MKLLIACLLVLSAAVCVTISQRSVVAAPTKAQRKEMTALRRDLGKIKSLLRKKNYEEAEELLNGIEERFNKLVTDGKLSERDRTIGTLKKTIADRKSELVSRKLSSKEISFEKDIGPILKARCFNCHGENPKGGLRLDSFAGLQKGGASRKPLIAPKNPQRSLLVARLRAPEKFRMPKDGEMLPVEEIETIAAWIKQGATFDGENRNDIIGQIKKPPAVIAMATGKETVSFTRDIAPFMTNLCLRCHGTRNPRSQFSLATFEKLMEGGESGVLVVGGDLEASRLWDLVGKQDPIKMPPGQSLITRSNHKNLGIWIKEGAKFDGKDPKSPIGQLGPVDAETRADQLAKLSADEFVVHRKQRMETLWKRVLPKEMPNLVESNDFMVYGNLSPMRLASISKTADEHGNSLKKLFGDKSNRLFKGKLTIFVINDRYGYEEFNHVIHRRDVPKEMTGHSVVEPSFEDAYIVLQDVTLRSAADAGLLQINLQDHLTGAYLKRSGKKLPDWILRGTGLAMASSASPKDPYFKSIRFAVPEMLTSLSKPEQVFSDGTFSPSEVGPVGFSLVEFLIRVGGGSTFGRFIGTLQNNNGNIPQAIKDVYKTDPNKLALRYLSTLPKPRKK